MSLAEPQIRLATAADAGAVSALLSVFSHTCLVSPTAEEAAFFAAALRSDGRLFHLFGRSSCQRQGLGRRLLELLRDRAHQAGQRCPFTVQSSLNALPVYERFGFQVRGARIARLDGLVVPMRLEPPVR